MKKLLKILGAIALAVVLVLAVLSVMVVDALRPERVDPGIGTPTVSAAPDRPAPRRAAEGDCSLRVQVLDQTDEAVTAAEVTVLGERSGYEEVLVTGQSGWTERAEWPCEVVRLRATDGADLTPSVAVLIDAEFDEMILVLADTVLLTGSVTDRDGHPIEHAVITNGIRSVVSQGGTYEIRLPVNDAAVTVQARDYQSSWFHPSDEALQEDEIEQDFILDVDLRVEVFCAGLPDNRCSDMLLTCSTPLLPMGETCNREGTRTLCLCPEGEAAVRGGGRSTLVGADEHEAWLDFRDTGSITGRVVSSGEPVEWCTVVLIRVPTGLEDIPRGLVVAQRAQCDLDGVFTLPALVSGDWELVVEGLEDARRILQPTHLAPGEHMDLGDVELWAGGGIEGTLIDGLTEAPTSGPIIALRKAGAGERTTPMGTDARPDGSFSMEGLPPGSWRVFGALSPHEYVMVEVEDGAITDGVEIITSQATALTANGLTLTGEDGALFVGSVAEGSPAGDAGLREGDEVIGIQLAGFELTGMGDDVGMEVARFVLGNWDGPGVTLVVDHEGEPLEIPLEW